MDSPDLTAGLSRASNGVGHHHGGRRCPRVKAMAWPLPLATLSDAILSGVMSGAVAGAMAGAAVSIRITKQSRQSARTKGTSSPATSVGTGHATVAGENSTIVQSFAPPAPPKSSEDTVAWLSEVRQAASSADHAYKLLSRADLALEAAGGLIDAADVHQKALDAQRVIHSAALGAPTEEVYDLLDTMERRLQGAANGFAYSFNYLKQNPAAAQSTEGRQAIRELLEAGLAKLDNGEIRRETWTDGLKWAELQQRLHTALRELRAET